MQRQLLERGVWPEEQQQLLVLIPPVLDRREHAAVDVGEVGRLCEGGDDFKPWNGCECYCYNTGWRWKMKREVGA
jgi:hypothetical protein